jgi:hypothetical protein
MGRKIIAAWLRANNFLPEGPKPGPKPSGEL